MCVADRGGSLVCMLQFADQSAGPDTPAVMCYLLSRSNVDKWEQLVRWVAAVGAVSDGNGFGD